MSPNSYQSLFIYGLLLNNPHYQNEKETPSKEWATMVYRTFAQEFLDLPPEDPLRLDRDERSLALHVAELDDNWCQRGDPVCIGALHESWEGVQDLFLGIRETFRQEFRFNLPDPIDRPSWDRLLRTKCEAYCLQYELLDPPQFYLISFLEERRFPSTYF